MKEGEQNNLLTEGSKFVALREVSILKRGAIEENHCSFQLSPYDVHTFFKVLATPLFSFL